MASEVAVRKVVELTAGASKAVELTAEVAAWVVPRTVRWAALQEVAKPWTEDLQVRSGQVCLGEVVRVKGVLLAAPNH